MGKSPEHHLRMRKFYFVVWALVLLAPLAEAKPFEFPADTFSFSNALYFEYRVKTRRRTNDSEAGERQSARLFSPLLCPGSRRAPVPEICEVSPRLAAGFGRSIPPADSSA